MPPVAFGYLCERFRHLARQSESVQFQDQQLISYLEDFPIAELERTINSLIPTIFHRQWIRTSLRGHLRNARKLTAGKADGAEFYTTHARALRWLEQAKKIFETVVFFTRLDSVTIKHYRLDASDLKMNDVVLSYKTQAYLRRSLLARLVYLSTNSAITHVAIACHTENQDPKLLVSGDTTHGLGTVVPQAEPGEILLVLRPRPHEALSRVAASIQLHREWVEQRRAKRIDEERVRFPELKCQVASAIGALTVLAGYLGQPLSLPNPFTRRPGVFCSELIDSIFAEAGLLLTPRSEQRSTVGPVELLYSPHLTLVGFISNTSETVDIGREIRGQFLSKRDAFLRGKDNFLQPTDATGACTIPSTPPR